VPIVLGQITLIVGCALALCVYVGWGAAALGLPEPLRRFAAPLTPLVGYALTIWFGYISLSSGLNLRSSLALLLLLATFLNMTALRRGARLHLGRTFTQLLTSKTQLGLLALLLATLAVGVLPLLHYGYLTAIGQGWDTESYLPLAQHLLDYPPTRIADAPPSPLRDLVHDPPHISVTLGFSAFQGMTMLLSGQSALATFAPLLALLRMLGVLAIYVWLRATMGLGRWAALLGAAGASAGALLLWVGYFNFGMQMAAWPLLALGLTLCLAAVEELALSTNDQRPTTNDIQNREPRTKNRSLALAGASLSSFIVRRWSVVGVALLAGVVLAALPATFYPALTIWLPMALALGVVRLLEAGLFAAERGENTASPEYRPVPQSARAGRAGVREAGRLALAALALGLVALLLAAPTIVDFYRGFSALAVLAQHIGPDRFIAPAETLGLLAFRLPTDGPQPPAALVLAATVLLGLLALVGLILPTKDERRRTNDQQPIVPSSFVVGHSSIPRLRWLAVAAAVLLYLAWLRFGRPYEYGYMKGSAFAGFVFWGLAAFGWQSLSARLRDHRPPATDTQLRSSRHATGHSQFSILNSWFSVLGLAVPLLVAIWAQALTVADYWRGPAIFTRDIAAFDSAAAQIPPGATVAVTSDAAFAGPISGQLTASLYGREIWGHLSTAYTSFDRWPMGAVPQYAVLAADEQAWPLDQGGQELWRSGTVALYRLGGSARLLEGRSDFYGSAPPTDRGSPAALALWRRAGALREASPGAPLRIAVGDTLAFDAEPAEGPARQQRLRLTVASLVAQHVTLVAGERREQVALVPGVSDIALPVATPAELTIAPEQPLALVEAVAGDADGSSPTGTQLDDTQIAWSAAAEQRGPTTSLRVELANPGRHALRLGLTVVEDTFDAPHQLLQVLAAAPIEGAWTLRADLARGATEARQGDTPAPLLAPPATTPDPPDGRYFGVLTIYNGEQPIAHAPVFTLSISGGAVDAFEPTPFTAEATMVARWLEPLPSNERTLLPEQRALDGGEAALDGALLHRRPPWPGAGRDAPLRPGDSLALQLGWRALQGAAPPLMVSAQLLGPDDRKYAQWDGPLGGEWRPIQSWAAGDRVRQDIPLTLDPATPPGSYRLLLVAYDAATGQPRLFGGQSALSLGEVTVR
jgi:hypothetical protein